MLSRGRLVPVALLMLLLAAAAYAQPDLVATKTNDVGGEATLDEAFTWTIVVSNEGNAAAAINFGFVVFRDQLPQGDIAYSNLQVGTNANVAGDPLCSLNSGVIGCLGAITGATVINPGGQITLSVDATISTEGVPFTNPRSGGECAVDPDNLVAEPNEVNNNCSDTVAVPTGAAGPDLTVSKSNDTGSATEVAAGPFTWSLQVGNGGATDATFASGQTILLDNLPNSGVTYGSATVTSQSGISGSGTISCGVASFNLTCSASGGSVTVGATTGSFTVEIDATPIGAGTLSNPRSGGDCAVDPNGNIIEDNEGNNACSDSVTVALSPDLTISKSNSVGGSGIVDEQFNWIVQVSNTGAGSAVIPNGFPLLIDQLPDSNVNYGALGTQASGMVTGTISCEINATTNLVCSASSGDVTLASGASYTVTVPTTPTATATYDNPRVANGCSVDPTSAELETNESNNTCSDTVVVGTGLTGPDLTAAKSNSVSDITDLASGAFTWSVQVTNGGDTAADFTSGQVLLRDNLPSSGLTYGSATVSAQAGITGTVSCAVAVDDLTCSASGALSMAAVTGTFTVEVSATPTQTGSYANPRSMGVCAADPDDVIAEDATGAEANNGCSNTVTVNDSPDLTATKSNSVSGVATLDEAFTWSIQVQNIGGAAFTAPFGSSFLVDNLPASGMTYGAPGISSSGFTGTLNCSIPTDTLGCIADSALTLDAGGSVTISWTATPTAVGSFDNPRSGGSCSVDVSNSDAELDESNNDCSDTVIVPSADLQLTKTDSQDPVLGSSFSYTLRVDNLGPSEATNVVVTDTLPAGVTFVSGTGCVDNAGTVTCTIASIANAGDASRTFEVSIDPGAPAQVSNTASVTADQEDPDSNNNTATEDTTLDGVPPEVTLSEVGGTSVSNCGSVPSGARQLGLTFSESMEDPAGNGGTNDVSNPANYLLLGAGADGTFQTLGCGVVSGDDEPLPISIVAYEDVGFTATLDLAQDLASGLHRLYVCSELRDLAENPLDGDGDGTGGDDALFFWRVEDALLSNGNFDCDLGDWDQTSTNPNEIFWSGDDVGGSGDSGSAGVVNLTSSTDFVLSQCVTPLYDATWELKFSLQAVAGGAAVDFDLQRGCSFFASGDCSGPALAQPLVTADVDLGVGGWQEFTADLSAPSGTVSGRCELRPRSPAGDAFELRLDAASLREKPLFEDGFETGDATSWTSSVP